MTASTLIRTALTIAALLAAGIVLADDEPFAATCIRVVDGDTLVVAVDDHQLTVDLAGIDAPELGQPFGKEVYVYLRKRAQGAEVEVTVESWEGDTAVGRVTIAGEDLTRTLARQGLARVTGETSDTAELESLATRARRVPSGIWLRKDPALPWNAVASAS